MSTTASNLTPKKSRRNISLPPELDEWLSSDDVDNASELIKELLEAYRAYGEIETAAKYELEKQQRAGSQ